MKHYRKGWPEQQKIDDKLKPFWFIRTELSLHNNLLLRGNRIVIPESLQQEVLGQLHEGHQGIVKCQNQARISVWWPGISKQSKQFIQKCPTYVLQEFSDCYRASDHYRIALKAMGENSI